MKFHFHDWENIYQKIEREYLNEKYVSKYVRFRICKKCKQIQERKYHTTAGWWYTLNKHESKILLSKIVEENCQKCLEISK